MGEGMMIKVFLAGLFAYAFIAQLRINALEKEMESINARTVELKLRPHKPEDEIRCYPMSMPIWVSSGQKYFETEGVKCVYPLPAASTE